MPPTMPENRSFSTPMMQQYMQIKSEYQDCILLFRLGDFYELFLDDAELGAKILGITLTARPRGKDGDIPMAGVPFHSADTYITKLVNSGYKVAICEQVSEPDKKGIVKRQVVRIITPGTVTDEANLDYRRQNYLLAIASTTDAIGLTFVELSTGEILVSEFSPKDLHHRLPNELRRYTPSEIIHSPEISKELLQLLEKHSRAKCFSLEHWGKYTHQPLKTINKHFSKHLTKNLELKTEQPLTHSLATSLHYLEHTQQQPISHLQTIRKLKESDTLILDPATITNLEIFETSRDQTHQGSLIGVLDKTQTAMGSRMLRSWLQHPLQNQTSINQRLETLEFLINQPQLRLKLQAQLQKISDLERLTSRLNLGLGNPKDLLRLDTTITHILATKKQFKGKLPPLLKHQTKKIDKRVAEIHQLITTALQDKVPVDPKKGNFIQIGVNQELDQLRAVIKTSKDWIQEAQEKERQRTGIGSLKIKFNKVFGYYIEVSKANLDQVPTDYDRKQTLVNAERFITPDLKHHEEIILANEAKAQELEHHLFTQLLTDITKQTHLLQQVAGAIATIDCLVSLAQVAQSHHYVKPTITTERDLHIQNGRHPVVEQLLKERAFVPNDLSFNSQQKLLIITGPNMAGKSVYMRQAALITLMAHIGSYVPADQATISLTDRIFVRSGAGDAIAQGLSTFMVEMVETARILTRATPQSLVIMDEIGRGTTTYDGISIAWAVAEYLVTHNQANTLFATHYHELQALEDEYPQQIKNYHAAVELFQGEPVFIHRVLPGKAAASYGISVAKLAGVPPEVALQAQRVLTTLENTENVAKPKGIETIEQLSLLEEENPIIEEIKRLDISNMTPLEALNILAQIKEATDS